MLTDLMMSTNVPLVLVPLPVLDRNRLPGQVPVRSLSSRPLKSPTPATDWTSFQAGDGGDAAWGGVRGVQQRAPRCGGGAHESGGERQEQHARAARHAASAMHALRA